METGRIGFLEGWGGDEFGYSYRYELSGQPEALIADPDTGMLTLNSALAAGHYPFWAVVRNREAPSKTARLAVALTIREGVTAHRSGSQILHRIYHADDPRFGRPVGDDYTAVLMNIRRQILAEQSTAGDDNFRATIRFDRGKLYQYSNNRWPWSAQYLNVEAEPSISPFRARPRLQCTGRTRWNSIQGAAIRIGRNWGWYYHATDEANLENPKKYAYEIYTTAIGSNQIRLKNAVDGLNLRPGRYHMVVSYDQQLYGFPPNARYFEYVRVTGVSGDLVTLDRKLRHVHRDDFLEVNDPNSLGRARIVVLDRGGPGGVDPADHRWLLRSVWRDIEFLPNPAGSAEEQGAVVQQEGSADIEFVDCIIPHLVPSNVRNASLSNCRVVNGEGDKQVGMFLVDKSTIGGLTECTGIDLMFLRDSQMSSALLAMPRQFRALRCTMNATNNDYVESPLSIGGPWATQAIEILATSLARMDKPAAAIGVGRPSPRVVLGVTAKWEGSRLVVPVNAGSDEFQAWIGAIWEGAILFQGNNPGFISYGVLRRLSAGGSALLYVDVDWIAGEKPTTGPIEIAYIHQLRVDARSRVEGKALWVDPGAMAQTVPEAIASGETRGFPAAYPGVRYGFGSAV